MNGFEKHNIKHSSASSINLWDNAPDVWIAEKLFGFKTSVGPAAHRGIAVEAALVNILANGVDHNEAIRDAIGQYNSRIGLFSGEAADKEREAIAPCVEQGYNELSKFGKPTFETQQKQNKIELLCKGENWELPIIGFLDLVYPEHGLIVDIKTSLRAPSEMSTEHARQAAIYRKASGNNAVKFLYLTPKRAVWHECGDVDGTLADIKQILTRQEYFLRAGDKHMLAKLVHVKKDNFYWNGSSEIRQQVFGV